jgi:glycine betaine/choline ABC-type transport system substrate-binding protein
LVSGRIDLYPEYSGTALTAILKMDPMDDPNAVEEAIRREYRARWDVAWLPGLGFNNAFAMVVRCEQARTENLRTLSDAARRTAPWRLGVGYEFVQRPDGLARLQAEYGLPLDGRPVDMDLGLLYRAVHEGQVDMAAGNATDGVIEALDLCVLEDDRRHFLPYRAAVAVRAGTLSAHDGLRAALAELEGRIGEDAMRQMNAAVDARKRPVAEVAREFLATLH